jgi:3',5'-cyclic AMP phosphodiesterase CpdA
VEDDASSPESRSLLSIAGNLLVEISLTKLVYSWVAMIGLPGLLLGLLPLASSAWLSTLSHSTRAAAELSPFLLVAAFLAVGWFVGRPALRLAEQSFWALNAIAVQPGYAMAREVVRHLAKRLPRSSEDPRTAGRRNAATAIVGASVASSVAILVAVAAWPHTRWTATVGDLVAPITLVLPSLANAVFLVSAAMAGASILWGLADAAMDQPRDLERFDAMRQDVPTWRVAHLSDVHVVGERHGLRIESGRSGPSGNRRFERVLARLAEIHAVDPLDLVVVTGDMTDAGRNAEWVEFQDLLSRYPTLRSIMLLLPGNHDVNIVDRANPARLDLPTSPFKRLRQMRTLAAMAHVQGNRTQVMSAHRDALGVTLGDALVHDAELIRQFADTGRPGLLARLERLWADCFPMVVPPAAADGLGVILLNSNADTHFSFTNALGLVAAEQIEAAEAILAAYPRARFVVALHHHLVEYPRPAKALSERIGTALINGTWVVRKLKAHGDRIVVLHGHRHIDWIGACGPLRIISAPSPVMGGTDDRPTRFHIHRFQPAAAGRLAVLPPQTEVVSGEALDHGSGLGD